MTQEDKELLLKDLSARLPYGVKVQYKGNKYDLTEMHKDGRTYLGSYNSIYGDWHCCFEFEIYPIPYLRPMSSMTEEEKKEYNKTCIAKFRKAGPGYTYDGWWEYYDTITSFDYLNANHFDYRGLIPKGLAIEVTKENNPYKTLKI